MDSVQGPFAAPKGAAFGAPMVAQGIPYAAPGAKGAFGAMPYGYGAMPYGYGAAPFGFVTPFGVSKAPGAGGYGMPFGAWGKAPYGV